MSRDSAESVVKKIIMSKVRKGRRGGRRNRLNKMSGIGSGLWVVGEF